MTFFAPVFALRSVPPRVEDAVGVAMFRVTKNPKLIEPVVKQTTRNKEIQARQKNLKALHEQGLEPRTIARKVGVGVATVWRDFRELKIQPNKPARCVGDGVEARRAKVALMLQGSMTCAMICKVLELSERTIRDDIEFIRSEK